MYEDIFESIRKEAAQRNLRESTANAYCNSVEYFLRTVNKVPMELTALDVDAFLTEKRLGDLSPETYNHYHSSNLKHKAIIATMYSSGLRVSEVVHLHYEDISRKNKTIHVRESKGRRDRYTILSDRNLVLLTEYRFQCGRPMDILFPSAWTGGFLLSCNTQNMGRHSPRYTESP